MNSLIGILAIVFTFGVAILAHEFGHFLFAKLLGVGVETFSIGMGKKLVKIKKGETTYCISAIPFGGYVALKGSLSKEMEDHIEKEKENEKKEKTEEPTEEKKKKSLSGLVTDDILMLRNKPLPVKILIYGAGVFFNYVVAILTFSLIMIVGIEAPSPRDPVVGYITPGTVPDQMGVKQGDVISTIEDKPVEKFEDFYERMNSFMEANATTMTITMRRDSESYKLQVPLSQDSPKLRGFISNFTPRLEPYIEDVMYNQPAEKAGIQPGDYIVGVNGKEIKDWMQLVEIIKNSGGKELTLRIKRGDQYLDITAAPTVRTGEEGGPKLGIVRGEPNTEILRLGVVKAFLESIKTSYRIMEFVVVNTYELFARFNMKEIRDNVGGPVAIAIQSYRQAKTSLQNYFYFFGAFNIMLMMLNILPLPILDGGHILFSVIETVFRRPISPKILIRIYTVMLVLLISLALLVTYNDIIRNLWRLRFW